MQRRNMSANDISITENERWFKDGVNVDDVDVFGVGGDVSGGIKILLHPYSSLLLIPSNETSFRAFGSVLLLLSPV